MSNLSADTVGPVNYSTKLNFRRLLEREIRREGMDYWQPNSDIPLGAQPFPYGNPTDVASSGNWSGVADKIPVKRGWFYRYITGANEDRAVNGSGTEDSDEIGADPVQAVGDEIWIYPKAETIGEPRTYQLLQYAPITLIHEARRPNGQKAVIVGTPTTLYRFFALENGDVYEDGVYEADVYSGDLGAWIVIADGFDPKAQRWEAVCINGTSIFNNGRDPAFSYRVEEFSSKPVYELREAGIAAVGCIAEFFGILMAGDISEIQSEKLVELFDPIGIRRSGAMLGEVAAGNLGRTTQDFFSADDVGRIMVFDDGTSAAIIVFNSAREVQLGHDTFKLYGVSVPAQIVTPQRFMLRTPAAQAGSLFSGTISGTQASGSPNVLASSAIFTGPMAGKRLRYVNGWSSVVLAFTDATHVVLTDSAPEAFTGLSFFVISEPEQNSADFVVASPAPFFTADMVGRNISWEDGTERRITGFIDSKHVHVDFDMEVKSDIVGVENPDTYKAYTEKQFINRVGYRLTWSMNELPTRFGPVYKGSMEANGFILKLDQPAKSIAIGDQVLVAGAGTDGGNLIANVIYVAAHRVLALNQRAATAMHSAPVSKADAASSIVGYDDLQDDSSTIIRMLELDGALVIYKDTAIATARYTGNIESPFAIQLRRIDSSRALFYRNTLIQVNSGLGGYSYGGSARHIYAGRNSFYSFKLVDSAPVEIQELELCKDSFFSKATLENSKWIFAANNILTKEIFFGNFPYDDEGKVLCLDYLSQPQTVSTSDMMISAASAVKRPAAGAVSGEIEDWFLLGTPMGVILLYGLVYLQSQTFDQAKQIFFRREANPFSETKLGYESRLKSGLSSFGSVSSEKDLRSFVPILSSKSAQTALVFKLYGTRNPVETPDLLVSTTVSALENLVSLFFRQNYFQDEIIVNGQDNPLELIARVYEISGVKSASFGRRVLAAP